ncbi:platelet endothelial aggregation receptor 1-like [Saccostrea cucullata]|uniref:platelet endothelial aggregation receptor 1-like n=1 Tax=Saccostrea cuccullata TaxID=36930 RepID=UPI002ED12B8D
MDWVSDIEYNVYVTHDSLVTNIHSLCDTEKSDSDQKVRSVVFQCSHAMVGSTIEIQAPPHVPLTIYEVGSASCTVGTYGEECDLLCPEECHRSCNKITGKCDQCPAGQFGDSCNLTCSKFCGQTGCNRTTGQCHQCDTNHWGPNCTRVCPKACSPHCQRETGHCQVCQSGHRFNGTTCLQCPSGSYGANCSQKCDTKCKDEVCDAETGKCTDCKEGFYGEFCQNECSSNCLNSLCSATTGECLKCEKGHYGTQCDPCLKGYYGEQCQEECDYCRSRDCDPVNGTCEQCNNGKFGAHCTQSCFSSCKNKSCYMNGECITCEKGYYGDYCESLCQPINCELCNKTSGECLQCITGWYGSDCTGVCHAGCKTGCYMNNGSCDDVSGKNAPISSHSMVNNVMILGGTALLIAFSIVFLVVICRFQKERNKTRREANYERSLSLPGQNSSHQYHSLVEEHIYQNVITEGEVEQEAEIEPVTENACAAIQDCNEFFKAEIKSDIQLPKRFMRFASLDEELLRRNRNRASELSTPYETIIIREDSSRVSYYKK